jgi:hypothetical protein
MSDRMKNVFKCLVVGVVWVYILSIRVGGQTLFHYANDILVQNQIVEAIDRQLADTVQDARDLASQTFGKLTGRNGKM